MTKRVAIIGAAYRFPGTTPETFWHDLKKRKGLCHPGGVRPLGPRGFSAS